MRTMDLDDLHIFRSVVREGGVVRAAARLNRVPSNVTTRIQQFEERLGVSLFRRQGRGLALTEAGRTLLGHAERLLQMAEQAEQELRSGAVRGSLRLGSLESAAGARLPPILSAFHQQYPEVSIELRTGTTQSLLQRLERFEIEAAFVSEPFDQAGLSSRPAFEEELVLISAKGTRRLRPGLLPCDRRLRGRRDGRGHRARRDAGPGGAVQRGRAPSPAREAAGQSHAPRLVGRGQCAAAGPARTAGRRPRHQAPADLTGSGRPRRWQGRAGSR